MSSYGGDCSGVHGDGGGWGGVVGGVVLVMAAEEWSVGAGWEGGGAVPEPWRRYTGHSPTCYSSSVARKSCGG